MPKHPLLPENYTDPTLQAALLRALKPYALDVPEEVINPQLKWDLQTAWNNAQPLLEKGGWQSHVSAYAETKTGWEMAADTNEEVERANTLLAGILARQMLEPESHYAVRAVEYRKGGEMAIVISLKMQHLLKHDYPNARYDGGEGPNGDSGWFPRLMHRLKQLVSLK